MGLRKLLGRNLGHATDAGNFGWVWRGVSGFGFGMLLHRLTDPPEPGEGTKLFIVLALSFTAILVGEVMLIRRQDEFFRQIELIAVAIGGLGGLMVASGVYLVFSLIGQLADVQFAFITAIAFFIGVRLGVSWHGFRHNQADDEFDDDA